MCWGAIAMTYEDATRRYSLQVSSTPTAFTLLAGSSNQVATIGMGSSRATTFRQAASLRRADRSGQPSGCRDRHGLGFDHRQCPPLLPDRRRAEARPRYDPPVLPWITTIKSAGDPDHGRGDRDVCTRRGTRLRGCGGPARRSTEDRGARG
jgi:hypothetical protein